MAVSVYSPTVTLTVLSGSSHLARTSGIEISSASLLSSAMSVGAKLAQGLEGTIRGASHG